MIKKFITTRKLKKATRNVQFHNFTSAKTVGIICSIKDNSDFYNATKYIKSLQDKGKKVKLIAYVHNPSEIGQPYFGNDDFTFYSAKHFSKLGLIKEKCISDFINTEFDILINLSNTNYFYLDYVFGLSKSHFKISGIIDCKYSDLNLNCDKSKGFDYFTSQINHYLSIIKKA